MLDRAWQSATLSDRREPDQHRDDYCDEDCDEDGHDDDHNCEDRHDHDEDFARTSLGSVQLFLT